jgi:hypothetical protein
MKQNQTLAERYSMMKMDRKQIAIYKGKVPHDDE